MTRRITIVPPNASFNFVLPVQPFAREIISIQLEIDVFSGNSIRPYLETRDRSGILLFSTGSDLSVLGSDTAHILFGPSIPMQNSSEVGPSFVTCPIPPNLILPAVGQLTVFLNAQATDTVRVMALATMDDSYEYPKAA